MRPGPPHAAPSDALYLATRGGAALLGREGELGVLEPGAQADLLLIDMDGEGEVVVVVVVEQSDPLGAG